MANYARGWRRVGWVAFGIWELITLAIATTFAVRWYTDPYRGVGVPITGSELHKAFWWLAAAVAGPLLALVVLRALLWVRQGFGSN
jgi:hypothetical protein